MRTGPLQLLAISGSLRAVSSNTLLIEAAAALAPPEVQVNFYRGLGGLPHFNPDLDREPYPVQVREWRDAVARADALLISSPEYAHGVPGTLKNGLDWLVSGPEFPAILVGLPTPSPRAAHAQAALMEILGTMSGEVVADASVVIPLAGRSLSVEQIVAEPALADPLRSGVLALVEAMSRRRGDDRRLVAYAGQAE